MENGISREQFGGGKAEKNVRESPRSILGAIALKYEQHANCTPSMKIPWRLQATDGKRDQQQHLSTSKYIRPISILFQYWQKKLEIAHRVLEHVRVPVSALREHDQEHVSHRPRVLAPVRRARPEDHLGGGVSECAASLSIFSGRCRCEKSHVWVFVSCTAKTAEEKKNCKTEKRRK